MRSSPWLVLLAVLLYGTLHSFLASLSAKARLRQWLGVQTDRWYRLAYNLLAVATLLPVLALVAFLPDQRLYAVPWPWAALFIFGQLVALALLAVGLVQTGAWSFLGLRQLVESPEGTPPVLVVQGLYRWVRHPLYSAGLLFIWLSPVMSMNLLALNIGLTLYILAGATLEERKLVQVFGQTYVEYRKHTPMLVPGLV
jgi:protein-S-isoprenylcysteine O-methyltransferase Ste14